MTTDHRAEAESLRRFGDWYADTYMLAAIHDLLDERLPKPPTGCPECAVEDTKAKVDAGHVHFWKPQQNVTSRGYVMPAIEVCDCGAARRQAVPEPESVTVTLPRDVVKGADWNWRGVALRLRTVKFYGAAALLDALADALDAATSPSEATPLTPADFGWTVLGEGQVAVDMRPGWRDSTPADWRKEAEILRKERPDALAAAALCEQFADALDREQS